MSESARLNDRTGTGNWYAKSENQKGLSRASPFFFLLVDSWLLSAGAAGVAAAAAGCAVLESVAVAAAGVVEESVAAGVASDADWSVEDVAPGVTISIAALFPAPVCSAC